jgi:hypothetical protein
MYRRRLSGGVVWADLHDKVTLTVEDRTVEAISGHATDGILPGALQRVLHLGDHLAQVDDRWHLLL